MNIEQLQEQISDMQEEIERLWNVIDEMRDDNAALSDRIDDCESNISSGF